MKKMLITTATVCLLACAIVTTPLIRDWLPFDLMTLRPYAYTLIPKVTPEMICRAALRNIPMNPDERVHQFSINYSSREELFNALGFELLMPEVLDETWKFCRAETYYFVHDATGANASIMVAGVYQEDPVQGAPLKAIQVELFADMSDCYISVEQSEPGYKVPVCGVPVYACRNIERWNGVWMIDNASYLFIGVKDEESLLRHVREILDGPATAKGAVAHAAAPFPFSASCSGCGSNLQ